MLDNIHNTPHATPWLYNSLYIVVASYYILNGPVKGSIN